MPRNEDGTWRPADQFDGWDVWIAAFLELAPDESEIDAYRIARVCERMRENPETFVRRWAWWHGVFDGGKMVPPNWPDALTAGDWKSLALFAENETKPKPVEV